MSGTPELDPIVLRPEHQAAIDADRAQAEATHKVGMEKVLADAIAASRRLAAIGSGLGLDASSIYGDHCITCGERWAQPADQATCAHLPICEDCWPNGCDACEAEVEETIRRREEIRARIGAAVLEVRSTADDLSEADLRGLDWRDRKDILRHAELAAEALRRVVDTLHALDRGAS